MSNKKSNKQQTGKYEVIKTFKAGKDSSWSIKDKNDNTPGFGFDSPQSAKSYIDKCVESGKDPMKINI